MKQVLYLTLEEVIYLHTQLIEVYGGLDGVRDHGLLESALARCKSGYYKTLSEQAAALLHSLTMNHCFVDGNKRVAFTATVIFLRLNGIKFIVTADEGEDFIINKLILSKCDFDQIVSWLESKMIKS